MREMRLAQVVLYSS